MRCVKTARARCALPCGCLLSEAAGAHRGRAGARASASGIELAPCAPGRRVCCRAGPCAGLRPQSSSRLWALGFAVWAVADAKPRRGLRHARISRADLWSGIPRARRVRARIVPRRSCSSFCTHRGAWSTDRRRPASSRSGSRIGPRRSGAREARCVVARGSARALCGTAVAAPRGAPPEMPRREPSPCSQRSRSGLRLDGRRFARAAFARRCVPSRRASSS